MFTINTEVGEETCVPYLHILGATMCSRLVVRAARTREQAACAEIP